MLNTGKLAGKTLYITGASRGIGKAIALKAAKDGANVVVAAKTAEPHPKLPGTIYTAAKEIEEAGGQALPFVVDVRSEDSVQESVEAAVRQFGGIDILINNASAISLTGTEATPMKKYDLMHQVNARGTYLVSKCAVPYLRSSKKNPHILNLAPPLNLNPVWFRDHCAYTMAKYGMSMCVLGMAEEFKEDGVAVNALWPKTAIITAAMEMLGGGKDVASKCRTTDIMADAAYVILTRDARNFTGQFAVDEDILREEGCRDFDKYAVKLGEELLPDFFLDGDASQIESKFKAAREASESGGDGGGVSDVFESMKKSINEEMVAKTRAVFAFDIKGDDAGKYFLDLKNAPGSCGGGEPKTEADVTFTLNDSDFQDMFSGKLKPTAAFMSGKLKLKGDMGKAMALDKIMSKMNKRGFHTMAPNSYNRFIARSFSDAAAANYTTVPEVFDRIKEVANEDIVGKINATYLFKVEGEGKYFVDLKNGGGKVTKGDAEEGEVADVTVTISPANIVKLFNREMKPATAFMTGQLKLAGDLQKAMALESVMKASRGIKDFHTQAGQQRFSPAADAPPALYTSVPEVFSRIQGVADEDIVGKVQAVYLFKVEETGDYYIDFKNGTGSTGEGEPPNSPADVTISMNKDNFLKIFNRELSPASAFMTGQIKVSGDLSKALTLEKVMKAAREKAEEAAKK